MENKEKEVEKKKVEEIKAKKINTDKKETKKKKNKNEYWILGIIFIIIIIAVVTALILIPGTPRKSVDGMLGCLKAGEFKEVEEFVNYQDLINTSDLIEKENSNQDAEKLLFNKLDWKVKKVIENNDVATVEVEVKNKDFKKVISNYIQKVTKAAINKQTITEQQYEEYLLEELNNEDIDIIRVEGKIEVKKQDGKWKVQVNEDLIKILLPELTETINSLNTIN